VVGEASVDEEEYEEYEVEDILDERAGKYLVERLCVITEFVDP
jgi:hypothetical protein